MQRLCGLARTVAISIRFISPPERVASASRSMYSWAQRPTLLKRPQHSFSLRLLPAARFKRRRTVIPLKRGGCWNAKPIPACARSLIERPVISSPFKMILPAVDSLIPMSSLASVDLPPPFGPVMTSISPSATWKLMSERISDWRPSSWTSKDKCSISNILSLPYIVLITTSNITITLMAFFHKYFSLKTINYQNE